MGLQKLRGDLDGSLHTESEHGAEEILTGPKTNHKPQFQKIENPIWYVLLLVLHYYTITFITNNAKTNNQNKKFQISQLRFADDANDSAQMIVTCP
ncbi:hypothetical protein L2E82_20663 [Cichorium intybus]|uniref:Uncharacterized protein n=1 Tax=Cichorium intybus TaxID=13427 RepID=A0ACB9DTI5_CICIN|nr:hypothetical protein L2E82_20663 [Cichorium intybus]